MRAVFHIATGTGAEHRERIQELRDEGWKVDVRTSNYFQKPYRANLALTDSEAVAEAYEDAGIDVERLWIWDS